MKFNDAIEEKKKILRHDRHGGEIFKYNLKIDPNSLLDFSTNINPLINPEMFSHSYKDSINKLNRYPDSNSTKLKKELVKYFEEKIDIKNLIIGAGSMELISTFCDIFINLDDEVIVCQPTFSEYAWAIKKNNGKIVNVYRKPENDFRIIYESILEKITPKTRIIFICNPNNPNGLLDDSKDIEKIINIASNHNILVFLDEAFIEFTGENNSFVLKIKTFNNLFISRSFTKFFGLAGLRVGFGVSNTEIIDLLTNGQVLWPINCFGQVFAQEILKSSDFIKETYNFISTESKFVKNELNKIDGLRLYPTNTNYILINTKSTGIKATKIKELLLKENILIRDCSNYDGLNDYYIRISIKSRNLNLKLINSLKKIIQK